MSRVLTGLLTFLIIGTIAACGGSDEPTPTATATAILSGEVVEISASNSGLDPQRIELQVGTTYVIRFSNDSLANTYTLIVARYDFKLDPLPSKNKVSDPFTETEAGEYPCFEFNRSIVPAFQCTLVFS